ncbi:facilitated trehalose transporter Tret1-like [Onthophagus taurus]|uniref:facilitated trehalose transporter Tret1-like n=1 Tax=Onthophagus taurus TaxID=166361 RepID=UPI0039BDF8E3
MDKTEEDFNLDTGGGDIHKPPMKKWRQIYAISSAAMSSFSCAMLFNWPSPAIPKLISDYDNITLTDASYLSVIPPIVTIIFSPFFGVLLDKFGRKKTLLSIAGFHIISLALIASAKTIWMFYLSRVFFGLSDVFMFGSLPIYIAEVASPSIRGTWGNAMMISVFLGQFVVNGIGYYCTIPTTAYILSVAPVIFFACFIFAPDTPYFYVMKDDLVSAEKSLKWLRGLDDVSEELDQITADVRRQFSDPGKYKDLFLENSNRKALIIVVLTRIIQMFSGIAAFSVYNQYIFKEATQDINEGHSAMIFNAILAIASISAPMFIEKIGRNRSMVISCLGSGVTLLAEAIYFYLQRETTTEMSSFTWFPIVGLVAYVIVFSIGLGLVPVLLVGELFPTNMRGHTSSTMNVIFALLLMVTTKLFHLLISGFGLYVPFAFFSICCFIGVVVCYFIVPETRGKTLEEIQQLLKKQERHI